MNRICRHGTRGESCGWKQSEWLGNREFESVYKNGDAAFNTDVEFRILAFEDYQKEKEWFVDFHDSVHIINKYCGVCSDALFAAFETEVLGGGGFD